MALDSTAPSLDLTGRVAIVTGGGGGLGGGTSAVLAAAGATVVCTDLDGARAEETAATLRAGGGKVVAAALDVTVEAACDEVVARTVAEHGRLDVMVAGAGMLVKKPLLETTEADLDRSWAVNVKGAVFCAFAAARVMVKQGSGSIVLISSDAYDRANPIVGAYAMSKAAVAQLNRALAAEIAPQHVRVNTVAPGWVHTGLIDQQFRAADGQVDQDALRRYAQGIADATPLGRNGTPQDIGAAIWFLASDASEWMTGQILRPNGGATMPW